MTFYLISGLGVDRSAFQRLQFPASIGIVHLDWITPQKNESIAAYARRLAEPIDSSSPFCVVGLSFGGMIAVEMSKFLSPQQAFIISSTPTYRGIPALYRRLGATRIHRILPLRFAKYAMPFLFWLFKAKTKPDKKLLRSIIRDADPKFLQWAIAAILNWRNELIPRNLFHIHGTEDRMLPVKKMAPDIAVKGAGHLMVYTHGTRVAGLILEKLQNFQEAENRSTV